jgi:hypothetical protein
MFTNVVVLQTDGNSFELLIMMLKDYMYVFVSFPFAARRYHIDAPFLVNVYTNFKFCLSILETVGIHIPSQNFRDFHLCTVGSSHNTCLSVDVYQLQILFAKI